VAETTRQLSLWCSSAAWKHCSRFIVSRPVTGSSWSWFGGEAFACGVAQPLSTSNVVIRPDIALARPARPSVPARNTRASPQGQRPKGRIALPPSSRTEGVIFVLAQGRNAFPAVFERKVPTRSRWSCPRLARRPAIQRETCRSTFKATLSAHRSTQAY